MTARYSLAGSRRLLPFAAAGALVGIALSAVGAPGGPVLTVTSLLAWILALHRFGRTGPDAAPRPVRRKKRPRREPT